VFGILIFIHLITQYSLYLPNSLMINYCIAVTRRNHIENINSIPSNCLKTINYDYECKHLQSISLNKCVKLALENENTTIFGFMDDDDFVVDCTEIVEKELKTCDVIYLNSLNVKTNKKRQFTGDIKKDIMSTIESWQIFLNKNVVEYMIDKNGFLFDESIVSVLGSYLMTQLLKENFNIKYINKVCYHYTGLNGQGVINAKSGVRLKIFREISKQLSKI